MNLTESVTCLDEVPATEENSIHNADNPAYYDSQIKKSILISLARYSDVPIEEFTILVNHGFVSIYGTVSSVYQKMMISAAIRRIEGVTDLSNNLCVASQFLQAN